jgi:hypothetical protein
MGITFVEVLTGENVPWELRAELGDWPTNDTVRLAPGWFSVSSC